MYFQILFVFISKLDTCICFIREVYGTCGMKPLFKEIFYTETPAISNYKTNRENTKMTRR